MNNYYSNGGWGANNGGYGSFGYGATTYAQDNQWGNWGNWGTGSWTTVDTTSIEERIERRGKIRKRLDKFCDDKDITARKTVGGSLKMTRRNGIYNITVPNNKEITENFRGLEELYRDWNKFPQSKYLQDRNLLVSTFIEKHREGESEMHYAFFRQTEIEDDHDEVRKRLDKIKNYFSQTLISEDDFKEMEKLIPLKKIKELEEKGGGHGGISNSTGLQSMGRKKSKLKLTKKPNKVIKEVSLTRGKRINRQYINNIDYRPLLNKKVEKHTKQEILILLDASGSMSGYPYKNAANFIGDLMETGLFNINVIHTLDDGVTDITGYCKDFSKGTEKFPETGGAEGFELLTSRLGDLPRNEDYILVFTDMCVPDDAEDNLRAFIGNKKHLVLSFGRDDKFEGLNIRLVKEHSDVKNVITTILG